MAKQWLAQGFPVGIPTETVYGLAANIFDAKAIASVYEAKRRPSFNPLIVHLRDVAAIGDMAVWDGLSNTLATAFMPGPFTLLLPKKDNVPDMVTAGSTKVAVRVPSHPLVGSLLRMTGFPLAAPSANPSGYVSPTSAKHVLDGLGGRIPYILDGGPCQVGLESTIVEVIDRSIVLHREGAIDRAAIEAATGIAPMLKSGTEVHAPGQTKSHYATATPLLKGDVAALMASMGAESNFAIITFYREYPHWAGSRQFRLSPGGKLEEAAQNLFATLRRVDAMGFDYILVEDFPDQGIGIAINDRLERARHEHKIG